MSREERARPAGPKTRSQSHSGVSGDSPCSRVAGCCSASLAVYSSSTILAAVGDRDVAHRLSGSSRRHRRGRGSGLVRLMRSVVPGGVSCQRESTQSSQKIFHVLQ